MKFVELELKYCERCGALWLRRWNGAGLLPALHIEDDEFADHPKGQRKGPVEGDRRFVPCRSGWAINSW